LLAFSAHFFFSSRRRHTRLTCDWSSDVCSSDLRDEGAERLQHARIVVGRRGRREGLEQRERAEHALRAAALVRELGDDLTPAARSEERRVGKECRSRWSADHYKKKRRAHGEDTQ